MLGSRQKYVGYQAYVAAGADDDILRYYNRGNTIAVLGDKSFRGSVERETEHVDMDVLRAVLQDRPGANELIGLSARVFSEDEDKIRAKPQGRRTMNPARAFAMWACQHYGALTLKDIARAFGLSHPGSASFAINKVKSDIIRGQWKKQRVQFEKSLYIVK